MSHRILAVEEGSPAHRYGIQADDLLLRINGEDIIDQIDYQALSTNEQLVIDIETASGEHRSISLEKDEYDPLGLTLEETMICNPRACRNKCIFCFIDQMPKNHRSTLYVKDDDWRLSLMMGNYVTLTNVSDSEFDRIIRRHASPLYISIHATDPETRCTMMGNRHAGHIMEQLHRLAEAGIRFHCQVVLCPGYNDGAILEKTLEDLVALHPAAQSVALVPVGLTAHREGLSPITPFAPDTACALIASVKDFQARCLTRLGTVFAYPADEFYALGELPIPPVEYYEDFPQIENGVGLLRMFIDQVEWAAKDGEVLPISEKKHILIACGTSVAPYLRQLHAQYSPSHITVEVRPIINHFFGPTVTVSGLVTGGDLTSQLKDAKADVICIVRSMLRAEGDLFLDDMSIEEVRAALPAPLCVTPNDGEAFYRVLMGHTEGVL